MVNTPWRADQIGKGTTFRIGWCSSVHHTSSGQINTSICKGKSFMYRLNHFLTISKVLYARSASIFLQYFKGKYCFEHFWVWFISKGKSRDSCVRSAPKTRVFQGKLSFLLHLKRVFKGKVRFLAGCPFGNLCAESLKRSQSWSFYTYSKRAIFTKKCPKKLSFWSPEDRPVPALPWTQTLLTRTPELGAGVGFTRWTQCWPSLPRLWLLHLSRSRGA